ncbi:RNA-binding domain-containing protein [Hyperthermus butylicus]|uniref:Conserved archaeal protein n=1 Tax=Hyperthermus butylicus (strain DSM 5456 / JCM 9403 / PLM1-5) TaxID=415426 RepID=A2BKA3_HYPBU|nr:RNA-binding domain-containing protein [Hyperthermus butylicus]ABM80414.1 conserved archaeal protein [Hyperthermus butylicus DSM 5456]
MSRIPTRVVGVEISVHAHATEDVGRVKQAVLNLLPESVHDKAVFEEQVLEGHHGNPITRIRLRLRDRDAEEFIKHLASMLSDTEKRVLRAMLGDRYDERQGRMYIRLSKQDAFLGDARLYDGDDVVHIVIILRGSPKLEEVARVLGELGLLA